MSAIGRIFLILNLILAAVFLGFAANQLAQKENVSLSLHNEQQAHEGTKKSLGDQITGLNTQVTQLKTDLSAMREDRDHAKSTSDRNSQDLNLEREGNAQLRGELTGIKESLAGYNNTIASLTSQKDQLVKEKTDALAARDAASGDKTKADKARLDAEEALGKANGTISTLELAVADAKKSASSLDTQLKALYTATGYPKIGTPQPLIEGSVISVNTSIAPGLIAINKGSKDNVVKGYVFEVFSGTVYKGRAQVQTVHDTTCSALMILVQPGTTVSQGDRVSTQI